MKLIKENYPELARSNVPVQEDVVSMVLGKEKSGYVRCFGIGPCPKDFATRRLTSVAIERENEKDETIRQLTELVKTMATRMEKFENLVEAPRTEIHQPKCDVTPYYPSHENLNTDSNDSTQVGGKICLKSIVDPEETIAIGVLYSNDETHEVGDQELRPDFLEVYVEVAVRPNERLVRSYEQYSTIGQMVGNNIAWLKCFVVSKDMDS